MIVQGTPEWMAERAGKVTASRVADILAKGRSGGESACRKNYMAQLVAERLTGFVEPGFTSEAMRWGSDQEPIARALYEVARDVMVDQVGFVPHPHLKWAGASPDGLVGAEGLVEFKCPNTATHIDYLLAKDAPSKYLPQMTWQLICTGRAWCDFVSYDPRMPEDLQLHIVRCVPSHQYINEVTDAVMTFLREVEETITKLEGIRNGK